MKKKSLSHIVVYIVAAIVMIAFIACLIVVTRGFTTDFQSFYVNVNGERVLESASGYKINGNRPMAVEVKYVFGKFSKEASGYSAKIVSADDVSFDFTVDDEICGFEYIDDFSAGFNWDLKEDSFTVSPKGNLKQILSAVYDGATIVLPDNMAENEDEIFKLIITSYNGKQSVEISFGILYFVAVEGITVPNTEIWL